jgi:uncharacterized protein YggU (UPF0235/DUF167 family)
MDSAIRQSISSSILLMKLVARLSSLASSAVDISWSIRVRVTEPPADGLISYSAVDLFEHSTDEILVSRLSSLASSAVDISWNIRVRVTEPPADGLISYSAVAGKSHASPTREPKRSSPLLSSCTHDNSSILPLLTNT